jgi:hypothetical protein
VLSVHARSCNLLTGSGEVIALVSPEIGDGPLNVVLPEWPAALSRLQAGTRVVCAPHQLLLPLLTIDLVAARAWEPRPDWAKVRGRSAAVDASLAVLEKLCLEYHPGNALLPLIGAPLSRRGRDVLFVERCCEAANDLRAGWNGDDGALARGGTMLAGLGDGLTPAGDDLLLGAMLWAWVAHPAPRGFGRVLSDAAAPRTTTLSAAFLRAAARGQCSAAWHRMLAALIEGRASDIQEAAQSVLAYGASSGLDALIGFLYLSQGDKEDACR